MRDSRYGKTGILNEYLIYPFNGPIGYDYNYSGTYSKFSLVDKFYTDSLIKTSKRLISGGVEWSNGLTFSISDIYYSFSGEILSYSASYPGLTLSNGDSSYPRIDSIVITEDGSIRVKKGQPSSTPFKTPLDEDEILIQYAYIPTSSTIIGTKVPVYLTNIQWQSSSYLTSGIYSGTFSLVSTSTPFDGGGDFCVDVTSDYRTGIRFTKPVGVLKISEYGSLTLRVRFDDMVPSNRSLVTQIQGTSSQFTGTASSSVLNLMSYGLDRNIINQWQHVVVPISKFGSVVTTIKNISFRLNGGDKNSNVNWKLDNIYFQTGSPYDEYMGEPDPSSTGGGLSYYIQPSNEWAKSVFGRTNSVPTTPSSGDRYLVISTPGDIFTGKEDNIAEYDGLGATWSFTTPTNGMSVRVDNEDNSIYRYEGDYSSGIWNKELLSQLRSLDATTSNLGLSYSAISTPLFDFYSKEMLYIVSFGYTNSGTSSLSVNNLGDTLLKKIAATSGVVDLEPNDLKMGGVYNISYDGTYFQVNLGGAGSGTIGDAEDGTYTDGLFTDFIPTTPIGTAVDRFNEILKNLVPPSAPELSDWSGSRTGGVNGKLSFDDSNTISGSTYIGANNATSNPISVDGTWTSTDKRFGIYAATNTTDITGTLNDQVSADTATPTPAYPSDSFGDGDKGDLKLYVNGVLVSTATLTTLSAQDTTSGGSTSGFNITASTASKFPIGTPFEQFQYRTGTWRVIDTDVQLVYGYNYVHAVHDNSPSFTRTLSRYEFIIDHDATATSITSPSITSYTLTGSKYLSGIGYFTGGSLNYDCTIDNLYRNTYYSGTDAITYNDNSGSGNGGTNPLLTVTRQDSLPNSSGDELKQIVLSTDLTSSVSIPFNIITSGKRRLNDSIGLTTTAKRTVSSGSRTLTTTNGTASISNVYLDNVTATSTIFIEYFNSEVYRLKGSNTYDTYGVIASNSWVSTQSLLNGDSDHNNGLQVYNDRLIYPVTNFSTPGSLTTNLNFGDTGTVYTSCSGTRTYIRYFRQVSPTTGNFAMTIDGSGTFVALGTALTGNNIHVELKAPGSAAQETGWLDCYNDFATNQWADGDGARNSTAGAGRSMGTAWGLTIGTKTTANTSGYIILKITVGASFTGYFDTITFSFG